jgi:MraZ protein
MPFVTSHARALDDKGRLVLPPDYREVLLADGGSGTFWATCYFGSLHAFLPADWLQKVDALGRIPTHSARMSHFKSKIMGLAHELMPDAQGRVRIPQVLLRAGGLEKDVMLVGMGTNFEIWDQAAFDALSIDEGVSAELQASGVEISL